MRLRATTKIRNDTLISAREKLGLSQRDFAKKMGISESYIFRLEKLDYRWAIPEDVVLKLSVKLNILPEQIYSPELKGKKITTQFICKKEVDTKIMLECITNRTKRLIESSPADIVEKKEVVQKIQKLINHKTLTFREKEILKLRYGINDGYEHTLEECGRIFKVSRDRIRQLEAKALRKLGWLIERDKRINFYLDTPITSQVGLLKSKETING